MKKRAKDIMRTFLAIKSFVLFALRFFRPFVHQVLYLQVFCTNAVLLYFQGGAYILLFVSQLVFYNLPLAYKELHFCIVWHLENSLQEKFMEFKQYLSNYSLNLYKKIYFSLQKDYNSQCRHSTFNFSKKIQERHFFQEQGFKSQKKTSQFYFK